MDRPFGGALRAGLILLLAALQACVDHPPKELARADVSASLQAPDAAAFSEPYLSHPLAWRSPKAELWGSRTLGSISPDQVSPGAGFAQSAFGQAALRYCQNQGGDHFWVTPDGGGALYWCTDPDENTAFFGFKLYAASGLLWLNVLSRGTQTTPEEFTRQMSTEYHFRTLAARQAELRAAADHSAAEREVSLERARAIERSRAHIDLSRGAKVCRYGGLRFGTYQGTLIGQPQYQYHEFDGAVEGRIDDISDDRKAIKVMVTGFSTPESAVRFSMDTPVQMGSLTIPNHQNSLVWDDTASWGTCLN